MEMNSLQLSNDNIYLVVFLLFSMFLLYTTYFEQHRNEKIKELKDTPKNISQSSLVFHLSTPVRSPDKFKHD